MTKIVLTGHFKIYNSNQFREDLSEIMILCITSNDLLWKDWKTKLLNVADKPTPIRQRRYQEVLSSPGQATS